MGWDGRPCGGAEAEGGQAEAWVWKLLAGLAVGEVEGQARWVHGMRWQHSTVRKRACYMGVRRSVTGSGRKCGWGLDAAR